jgi:hypothetical protein
MSRKYRRRRHKGFFFFPLIALAFLFLMGGVVMWLWNAILPDLVAVNPITYWQAVGLLLLCRILFGNFRKPGPFGNPRNHRRPHSKGHYWKEKWKQMSPEERAEMKEKWKKWWDRDYDS